MVDSTGLMAIEESTDLVGRNFWWGCDGRGRGVDLAELVLVGSEAASSMISASDSDAHRACCYGNPCQQNQQNQR